VSVHGKMRGARLWRLKASLDVFYVKIAEGEGAQALRHEIERTAWLATNGARVAKIVRTHDAGNLVALLSKAVEGKPADEQRLPLLVVLAALGRGLADLHRLPASACPFDESVMERLARADRAIAAGGVDAGAFAERNRGIAPDILHARLAAAIPREDIVVVHGDAALSNLIIADDGSLGFVDCGHSGWGDRHIDLGVVAQEIGERWGEAAIASFAASYGATHWDRRKARYFADLYELF
jgi:aminoglycoside phosphotransferase